MQFQVSTLRFKLGALLCLFMLPATVLCQAPKLLKDINRIKGQLGTLPFYAQSGTKIFFAREDAANGEEIWITDGTAAGTSMLKDINPGPDGSFPMGFAPATVGGNPVVYFAATTPALGTELWISDGTPGGTTLVEDIFPGPSSGVVSTGNFGFPRILTLPSVDFAIFPGNDGVNGTEPWIAIGGTAAGTEMLADINPGAFSSVPEGFAFTGPFIMFAANDGTTGQEPWITNGNPGFAVQLSNIAAGANSSEPYGFMLTTNGIVFAADDQMNGLEPWTTNIFVTTAMLSDLSPGPSSSFLANFISLPSGNGLFTTLNPLVNPPAFEIYSTDGTTTSSIGSLDCLPGGIFAIFAPNLFTTFAEVNGQVLFPCQRFDLSGFFGGDDPFSEIDSEPWVTDGTLGSPQVLRDIFPGSRGSEVVGFHKAGNSLIMSANDAVHGVEPWVTDGTAGGTALLADLNPGEASSMSTGEEVFTAIINSTPATATLLNVTVGRNRKVYYSDGSAVNTREIFDNSATNTDGSEPSNFVRVGRTVVFNGNHGPKGIEPFVTNGTRRGTKLLKNIFRSGSSNPRYFQNLTRRKTLFAATSPAQGRELWATDGTRRGTRLVRDLEVGSDSSHPELFGVKIGRKALFAATDSINGRELWVTNGKANQTIILKDISPGTSSSSPESMVLLNGKAIFAADDGINGEELWISDGTSVGTSLLIDIFPGATGSTPDDLTVVGSKIFFTARDAASGNELWVSDGTAAGTQLVKDIYAGAFGSYPDDLVGSDGILYFQADDNINGYELWRSDGTPAGSFMIEDIRPGGSGSSPEYLAAIPGVGVVFAANDGANGTELWISGPGLGSASLLKDIEVGASSSFPYDLYAVPSRGVVYFSASNAAEGRELWRTNGTVAGTVLVADIVPGADSSDPRDFFAKGRKLFFGAATATSDSEPMVVRIP